MTPQQREVLQKLCARYKVEFHHADYTPQFDLPEGYVAGWIGGTGSGHRTIYIGVSPEGEISS